MKNLFIEYNPLDKEKLQSLWDSAIFVFDTNVLLNLYRYSDETSSKFVQNILDLKNRVWLPYQVGLEFHRNRLSVISEQKKLYDDFDRKLNEIISDIENKNRNPFISSSLYEKILLVKNEVKSEIDHKINAYEEKLINDSLLAQINSIFDGRVGNLFTEEELKSIYTEGKKRYEDKTPPGYCDIKKPENERYGDLILWKQIISKSKSDEVDIIFVLDDRKEDWWLDHQGKTISPRPELLKEFILKTNKLCHFYKPFQFLEYSNKYLGASIKEEIIEEVKNYTPIITKNENFIQLNLVIQGTLIGLNSLINDLKNAGYDIYSELGQSDDFHDVIIILPNIPDLERRLNAKYLLNLSNYNLNLISINKT